MGEVYRATDYEAEAREVAIKILPPSLAADPDRLAQVTLRHAHVLRHFHYGLGPNIGRNFSYSAFAA